MYRARQQRTHTFSDFPRCGEDQLPSDPAHWPTSAYEKNYCKNSAVSDIFAMGYSLRSENMQYTRWMRWNGTALAVHADGWLDDSAATSSLCVLQQHLLLNLHFHIVLMFLSGVNVCLCGRVAGLARSCTTTQAMMGLI